RRRTWASLRRTEPSLRRLAMLRHRADVGPEIIRRPDRRRARVDVNGLVIEGCSSAHKGVGVRADSTMNTLLVTTILAATLLGALFLGRMLRSLLPAEHLSAESKDAVKVAMGMVATMTALLLGLLVSSAKATYDTTRSEIMQLAAKV